MSKRHYGERRPDWKEEQERDEELTWEGREDNDYPSEMDEMINEALDEADLAEIEEEEDEDRKLQMLCDYEEKHGELDNSERRELGIRGKLLTRYKSGNFRTLEDEEWERENRRQQDEWERQQSERERDENGFFGD